MAKTSARTATANKLNARLSALSKKGYPTSIALEEIDKIPGVKISKKTGRIIFEAKSYSENSEEIIAKVEEWVPTVKNYSSSKLAKKSEKILKSRALEMELNSRAEEMQATFNFNPVEYLDLATEVEGISKDAFGNVVVDPEMFSDEMEEAALSKAFSAQDLMEEAKNQLIEDGLSEAEVEAKSEEDIISKAKDVYLKESDTSVFKKYYKYFTEKHSSGEGAARAKKDSRIRSQDYEDATKKMSEVASLLSKTGYSMDYYEKKKELEAMLTNLKTND